MTVWVSGCPGLCVSPKQFWSIRCTRIVILLGDEQSDIQHHNGFADVDVRIFDPTCLFLNLRLSGIGHYLVHDHSILLNEEIPLRIPLSRYSSGRAQPTAANESVKSWGKEKGITFTALSAIV